MRLLHLSQARFLLQAPWSTLTVVIGIALGVASVTAVHLISVSINNSLAAVTPAYLRELTYLVEKPQLSMADYFELRAAWRRGEYPEVTAMVPIVEGQLLLEDQAVRVVGVDAFSGISSLLPLAALPPRGLLAAETVVGRSAQNSAVSWEPAALSPALPGFQITRLLPGISERLLIADLGTAQELLQLPATALSRVGVTVAHPLLALEQTLDKLLPGAGAGFAGFQWSLPGWQVRTLDSELPSQAFAQSVLFNLGALGSLALVVSWLLVYQVGLMWLRRRRPAADMLHFLGVTRAELRSGYLLSLLPLALLATGAGIAAGWALAQLLSRITTAGLGVTTLLPALDLWVLGKAVGSGLGVSLIGGLVAFRQEWRLQAVSPRLVVVLALLLLPLALAGIWYVEALWGGFLAIVALCLLVILVVSPVLRSARIAARRAPGLSLLARVGVRELVWYPRALAVAIAALTLAIASSIAVGIMVDSFRADFARMLDLRLSHDVFVRSSGTDVSAAQRALQQLPEVVDVVAAGHTMIRIDGIPVELGYSRFDSAEARRYGANSGLLPWQALVNERLLRMLRVEIGDSVTVAGRQLLLVGSFPGFGDAVPRLLVDEATARRLVPGLIFDRLSVSATAIDPVTSLLAAEFPQLEVQLSLPLRQLALRIFDQTFAITRALTLLALIVASIGLYNALLGLRLTQQTTLQLLFTMGVSAAELRRIALWRGLGVGAAVLGFALPLGLAMGWLLCNVINPRAFGWSLQLQLAPGALLVPVLLGLAVIIVTSLLPAPREKLAAAP